MEMYARKAYGAPVYWASLSPYLEAVRLTWRKKDYFGIYKNSQSSVSCKEHKEWFSRAKIVLAYIPEWGHGVLGWGTYRILYQYEIAVIVSIIRNSWVTLKVLFGSYEYQVKKVATTFVSNILI